MRKYTINVKDKTYDLVLTRNTVKWLESNGFSIQDFEKKPITYYDLIWASGFIENHPNVNANLAQKIMTSYEEEDGDVADAIQFIIEEYSNFINALTDTKSKKKKGTITEI